MSTISKLTAAAACALTLAACGGGGGGDSYTVTPSSSRSGGTISPSKAVSVSPGSTASFQVTPNSGYTASVGGTCGGTLSGTTYTTKAITADCSVVVTFASRSLTSTYEGLPVAADATSFLAQVNQEGAKGYRYLYDSGMVAIPQLCPPPSVAACPPPLPPVSVFLNDGTATGYAYELLSSPGNLTDFITQANTEGAKGYQYVMPYGDVEYTSDGMTGTPKVSPPPYMLYRKDNDSAATYAYVADAVKMGGVSVDDFLSQATARGQSGYWLLGQIGGYYYGLANLYTKDNASNSTYTYEAVRDGMSFPSLDEINNEGARGYRPIYPLTGNTSEAGISTVARLYMKDQAQPATFIFQQGTNVTTSTPLITQLNDYGAQGYVTWMGYDGSLYYFEADNCNGWWCTTFNMPMGTKGDLTLYWYGLD